MLEPIAADVARRLETNAAEVDDAWQIPPDEAVALHQIIVAARCISLLEIGVSYGYSTLHLAHAARINGGHLHAVEASQRKADAAAASLSDAGLSQYVTIHLGRAQEVIPTIRFDRPPDFLFIDAVKAECFEYLDTAWPRLADQCLIITDNTLTHADELESFLAHLRVHPEIVSSETVRLGNGFEISVKRPRP